ncbi:MAG: DUF5677 domain-containing protein [Nanoarchaeota archaeon]
MISGKIVELKKKKKRVEKTNVMKTNIDLKEKVKYLKKQKSFILEIIIDNDNWALFKPNDANSSLFLLGTIFLSDMVRKEEVCIQLICKGYYNEAGLLVRSIMESSIALEYMVIDGKALEQWFERQKFYEEKFLNWDEVIKNGKSTIKYKDNWPPIRELLKRMNKEKDYSYYVWLSQFSHHSKRTFQAFFDVGKKLGKDKWEGNYYYAPRYNKNNASNLFDLLFNYINVAFWRGWNKTYKLGGVPPKALLSYKNIQKKTNGIFKSKFIDI